MTYKLEPFIKKADVLKVLEKVLLSSELEKSSIYWFPELVPKNTIINTGLQLVTAPFNCVLVFIDISPHYNWAHPCIYLLVGKMEKQIVKIESSFPPKGFYDDNSSILLMKDGKIIESDTK